MRLKEIVENFKQDVPKLPVSSAKESYINEAKLDSKLVKQYEKRANNERKGGGKIEIDYQIPTISITMSNGDEYFFQEHQAEELLDEVPDNIEADDFILAQAQEW